MKLKVYSKDGSSFTEQVFENIPQFEGDKGVFALKETVVAIQANRRLGSASTLDYGEVSGSNRKPFKQKGGGRARQGTMKSPIHRGGAVVFGPHPRDWSKKINRKVKVLALSRALFDKCGEGDFVVIEDFESADGKTKGVASLVSKIRPKGKVLLVSDNFDEKFFLAGRNIARVDFCETAYVSPIDFLEYDGMIVSRKGLDTILTRVSARA